MLPAQAHLLHATTLHTEPGRSPSDTVPFMKARPGALCDVQLGNWEVEVDAEVPRASLDSGSAFLKAPAFTGAPAPSLAPRPLPLGQTRLPVGANRFKAGAPLGARRPATDAQPAPVPEGAYELGSTEGGRAAYIDAFLVKHLRPHQLEGVKFLFEVCAQSSWAC